MCSVIKTTENCLHIHYSIIMNYLEIRNCKIFSDLLFFSKTADNFQKKSNLPSIKYKYFYICYIPHTL